MFGYFVFFNTILFNLNFSDQSKVQERVWKVLTQMEQTQHRVNHVINEHTTSKDWFEYIDESPYYIYVLNQAQQVIYWNTNAFVPSSNELAAIGKVGIIANDQGRFLVYKSILKNGSASYTYVAVYPLHVHYSIENQYLKSALNTSIFSNEEGRILFVNANHENAVYDQQHHYLFSYSYLKSVYSYGYEVVLTLYCLLLVLYVFYIAQQFAYHYITQKKYNIEIRTFWYLLIGLLLSQLINYLHRYVPVNETMLFNSHYFAYSIIISSFIDLLLWLSLFLYLSFYLYKNYYRLFFVKYLIDHQLKKYNVLLIVLNFILLVFFTFILQIIIKNISEEIDITQSLQVNFIKMVTYVCLVLIGVGFYFVNHILLKIVFRKASKKMIAYGFLALSILSAPLFYWINEHFIWIPLIHSFFVILLRLTAFYKFTTLIRYQSYIYFFVIGVEISIFFALVIYDQRYNLDYHRVEKFFYASFEENDIQGEYLLEEELKAIANDQYIQTLLWSPFSNKSLIKSKIYKTYLSSYFDKYDIEVLIYNPSHQNALDTNDTGSYLNNKQYLNAKYVTNSAHVYLVKPKNYKDVQKYIAYTPIYKGKYAVGYLMLVLKFKKHFSAKVFPSLLIDEKYKANVVMNSYDFAVYENDKLKYTNAKINYFEALDLQDLRSIQKSWKGIQKNNYRHIGFKRDAQELVVVSIPSNLIQTLISNFSFALIGILILLLVLVLYSLILIYNQNHQITFASKIQIYIGLAFFIPLCILSVFTISIVIENYKSRTESESLETASRLSQFISDEVVYTKNFESNLFQKLSNVKDYSSYADLQFNVYNVSGKLLYATQPDVFKKGIYSNYINPLAYEGILVHRNQSLLLNEKIGSLNYKMVYTIIKSKQSGKVLAILSIPYFDSSEYLSVQILKIVNTIINVFVFVFMVLMLMAYFVSKSLIKPLQYITKSIGKVSLTNANERIAWYSNDEIGQLVQQYNLMLSVLEANKVILSKSEKETAWREMAKQVAHEIKNPLTPIKLNLQLLQRKLNVDELLHEELKANYSKTIESILLQVDNLTEIANSFSNFAKLPEPVLERIDLLFLLKEVCQVHQTQQGFKVNFNDLKLVYIIADKGWMINVLNNIIINAFQSISQDEKPSVEVELKQVSQVEVCISITDNGEGIPEDIQDKVFVPNFSTKYNGSGIGLAIAKKGVELMGGQIYFETSMGKGTTFYIVLPIQG